MESFAVPVIIIEAAARTIQTIVGHLVHDVIDQVGVLSHGGSGNRLIADHFRRNLCLADCVYFRKIRLGTGIRINRIVHFQFPFVGVFAGFGIFGFKHVRTSVNAPDLEGIRIAGGIVRRLCKQDAFATDVLV